MYVDCDYESVHEEETHGLVEDDPSCGRIKLKHLSEDNAAFVQTGD